VAIREAFAAAREDDPRTTKMGFARENADKFGVSGASVIRVLTD
jgi:hypothetical protein